jgi:hypothetical protein
LNTQRSLGTIYHGNKTKPKTTDMKKIIFTLLIAFLSAVSFTACTEEEVAPSTENGGATYDIGKVK